MKIRFCLFFFLLLSLNINAQQVDSDNLIKEIKVKTTNFFIEQGVLDKNTVKNSLDYVFVTEIHDKKIIGYNIIGIYRIGVLISHSAQHILVKEKSNYKIFNVKEIDILLKEIVDYSSRNKIEKNLMVLYIKNVISLYEETNKKYSELLSPQ